MVKTRDPYLDLVKGILILLVIFGHMLESADGVVGDVIYHFIYFFHMPLFVLISGYLTKSVQSLRHCISRNTGLLETLIFFQGILILLGLLQGKEFSWHSIVTPVWAMWYMLSFFWWRLLVTIINPSKYSIQFCVISSLLLCLFAGYLPFSHIASFQRTFYFFPFFMIGHCLGFKKKSLKDYGLSFNKSIFVLVSALLGCIYIVGYKSYSFESLLYGSYCYDITDGLIFNGGGLFDS